MIFFFYGANSYAARQQIGKLIAQYRHKTGSDLGLERLDGAVIGYQQLQTALQASPLLSTSRLMVIEDTGSNAAVSENLGKILDTIPDSTVAVFYDSKVDKRSSYYKQMTAHPNVTVHAFEALSTAQLLQWIEREVKKAHGVIDRPTANYLLERAGDDQWRLAGEIAKLVAYNEAVTREHIDRLVAPTPSDTIFNLVDAMTAGNTASATRLYRSLLADQVSEYYILTMIIWQLRNLVLAKAGANLTAAELAKAAGLSPFVAGKVLVKVRPISQEQLHTMFVRAVDTDYQIKSGLGKSDVLVEKLVVEVAQGSQTR